MPTINGRKVVNFRVAKVDEEGIVSADGTIQGGSKVSKVKKMKKKGHTSVPYGSGYKKVKEASCAKKSNMETAAEYRKRCGPRPLGQIPKIHESEVKTIHNLLQKFGNSSKDATNMIKKHYKKVQKKFRGQTPRDKTMALIGLSLLGENKELYKMYTQAMKMMPGSPKQKELIKKISVLRKKLKMNEAPRKPRKKGQPAGSKKHSDLYTDENPKGTIHGLKFATVKDAQKSVSKINGSGKTHAHKIQAAVAMEQRAREMGKTSQAAVYRAYINKMKKKTKKKNEEFGAPPGMLPSPSRKTVKKMKRKGHTSVPYGSGYKKVNENDKAELYKLYTKAMKMMPGSPNQKKIKKQITVLRKKLGMNEMLNYPFYGRNVAQVPGNQKDGADRYYLPKKYRKKNEAVVIEVTECGCSNIYKVEKVNEKWSKKYKKSINCSNPKGFSQKAHCAGRKKK